MPKGSLQAPLLANDSLSGVPMDDMALAKSAGVTKAATAPPSAPDTVTSARRTLDDLVTTGASEMPTVAGLHGSEGGGGGGGGADAFRIRHAAAPAEDPLLALMHRHRNDCKAFPAIGGRIVPQGHVAFTLKNGKVGYLAPGRRRILDPLRRIHSTVSVNDALIQVANVTFCRVRPGQLGLALHRGVPVVLEVGRHMLEAPEWQFVGTRSSLDDHVAWGEVPALHLVRVRPGKVALLFVDGRPRALHHRQAFYEFMAPREQYRRVEDMMKDEIRFDANNSLDIVRVRPGTVGLMWQDAQPVVLAPSETPYELRAPRQQFVKIADSMDECLSIDDNNSMDIVRVRPGKIGLLWEQGKPRVIVPRAEPYVLRKPRQQFVRLCDVDEEHIALGSLHIVTIATGRRGVVWVRGQASIVEAGQTVFEEQNFRFGGSKSMSEVDAALGPFRYVTVASGEVGVKHTNGELEVLYAGTHCLATQRGETFHGFVSVQQQVMKVRNLKVITLDNVELRVDAVMTYFISDPEKAIRGVKNLDEVLRQRTETTLSNIFSHSNYGQARGGPVVPSAVPTAALSPGDALPVAGGASPRSANAHANANANNAAAARAREMVDSLDSKEKDITTLVHDEFMRLIKKTAAAVWGVDIGDLSVDNIQVVNDDLAHDLEQRAVTTVKTATQRANAENAAKVELIKADANARAKALEAQGDTAQAIAQARAQAQIVRARAEAEAAAARIEAEGKSEALRIMSQAKADARVMEAEAEKKALKLEAEGMEVLGANAMRMRQWQTQQQIALHMFKNQRTFVDTRGMPSMAELLNMNLLGKMGMFGGGGGGTSGDDAQPADDGKGEVLNGGGGRRAGRR